MAIFPINLHLSKFLNDKFVTLKIALHNMFGINLWINLLTKFSNSQKTPRQRFFFQAKTFWILTVHLKISEGSKSLHFPLFAYNLSENPIWRLNSLKTPVAMKFIAFLAPLVVCGR